MRKNLGYGVTSQKLRRRKSLHSVIYAWRKFTTQKITAQICSSGKWRDTLRTYTNIILKPKQKKNLHRKVKEMLSKCRHKRFFPMLHNANISTWGSTNAIYHPKFSMSTTSHLNTLTPNVLHTLRSEKACMDSRKLQYLPMTSSRII